MRNAIPIACTFVSMTVCGTGSQRANHLPSEQSTPLATPLVEAIDLTNVSFNDNPLQSIAEEALESEPLPSEWTPERHPGLKALSQKELRHVKQAVTQLSLIGRIGTETFLLCSGNNQDSWTDTLLPNIQDVNFEPTSECTKFHIRCVYETPFQRVEIIDETFTFELRDQKYLHTATSGGRSYPESSEQAEALERVSEPTQVIKDAVKKLKANHYSSLELRHFEHALIELYNDGILPDQLKLITVSDNACSQGALEKVIPYGAKGINPIQSVEIFPFEHVHLLGVEIANEEVSFRIYRADFEQESFRLHNVTVQM